MRYLLWRLVPVAVSELESSVKARPDMMLITAPPYITPSYHCVEIP